MTRAYVKVINTETLEVRLLKVNGAVERMLVDGNLHWGRRRSPLTGKVARADVLLVENEEAWAKLLPYFSFEEEAAGRKHEPKYKEVADE